MLVDTDVLIWNLRGNARAADRLNALIAATAIERGLDLLTANDRHYRHIEELGIEVFRP